MEEQLDWDEVPALMNELRRMARGLLALEGRPGSVRTTALVVSALRRQKLASQRFEEVSWRDRDHFFAAVYGAMRRSLIDHGRRRTRERAPLEPEELDLESIPARFAESPGEAEALAHALEVMALRNPRWAELVQHRYFAGLTLEEAAEVMGVPERSLRRWWQRARLLLADEVLRFLREPRERREDGTRCES